MSSLWHNPKVFIDFLFSISISWDSGSYFIEMIMLINFECTLAQTRMEFGKVTLPSKGPICLIYGKIPKFFYRFLFSMSVSGDSASICLK